MCVEHGCFVSPSSSGGLVSYFCFFWTWLLPWSLFLLLILFWGDRVKVSCLFLLCFVARSSLKLEMLIDICKEFVNMLPHVCNEAVA
jgi:hypothetical protein